ncbi:hypothetical protein BAUCODRAFT_123711 [Baudoinia panamericana UAMH 10762]|uniref:Uncharacterized protein n=1 Tax=Baudoinia panamericana (strain UAMH 10762) TaxID=717646 RepID=M2MUJ8_BAUPA|nr:uncharacterized protein BAUCODRAFT_123711 [Baudoinia panamericana UAMH 10762]EMC95248.1 hypothetical protein BAUCODRAFT_123711 [Baudoinia panamericana UAMH 10762]
MLAASALVAVLCWSVRLAGAATGHVYVYDGAEAERQQATASRSLSPVQARLVLAQRAGVEDYHSADLREDGVLRAINDFGRRRSLFAEQELSRKALLLVEGVRDAEAELPQLSHYRSFAIDDAPGASATRGLWTDLGRQSLPSVYPSDLSDGEIIESMQDIQSVSHHDFLYIAKNMPEFQRVLDYVLKVDKHALTVYVSPPGQYNKEGEWDVTSPWGTYEMPGTQSPLKKREARAPVEEPLELEPEENYFNSTSTVPNSASAPLAVLASNESGSPLTGILPACFPSLSSCQSSTRNCTGHGSCRLAYVDQSAAAQSPFKNCYSCQCTATKRTTGSGGTKTTYWGGPACQKKDVSVEFWMIALFSVGMVALLSFAVGSIWGMGDDELPSVIGAGVSGPVKRS